MLRPNNQPPFSRTLLVAIGLAGLLSAGCVARVHSHSYVRYSEPVVFADAPTLVYVSPGVYVVRDYDSAVYYSDGYYWTYRDGVWYHTTYWNEPWVVAHVHVVPTVIVHQNHHSYVHYHGSAGAQVYSAPQRTYHAANASSHVGASPQPAPAGGHAAGSVTAGKAPNARVDTVYTTAGGTMDAQAGASVRGPSQPDAAPVYVDNGSRGATTVVVPDNGARGATTVVVPDNGSRGATTVLPAPAPAQRAPSGSSAPSAGRSTASQPVVQTSAPAPVVAPAQRHGSAAPATPVQTAPAKKTKKPASTSRKPTRGGT